MAARTIALTDTLETFRTQFNALSEQDFGDISTLDSGIVATSVIGAVNELYTAVSGALAFDITDGSNTETVTNSSSITFAGTSNQIVATVGATDTVTLSLTNSVTIPDNFTASGTGTHSLGTIQFAGNTISSSDSNTVTINGALQATSLKTSTALVTIDETVGFPRIQSSRGDKYLAFDAVPTFTGDIIFEGATPDSFETTITAVDPTADRTITIPNETGTIVTTGSTGVITGTMIASDTIAEANMADDAIGQDQLKNVVSLQILNSTGTVLKTLYGAGA
jgi:hypothetical protein